MALKDTRNGRAWTTWDAEIRRRGPHAAREWTLRLASRLNAIKYRQFEFFRQWEELKAYCRERDIRLMGDIPIYGAHGSADVWALPGALDDR